ncbi:hypothetical protein PAMP_008715 [Pampus punctatissimus]
MEENTSGDERSDKTWVLAELQTSHFIRLHEFRSCRPALPEKREKKSLYLM